MSAEQTGRSSGWAGWLLGNRAGDASLRWGLLPVRVMVGLIFARAGAQKAFGWFEGRGFERTVEMLAGLGFPAAEAFAVMLILAELIGGILLLVGLAPRLGALVLVIVMVVALLTAHLGDPFAEIRMHWLLLTGSITLLITGAGLPALQWSRPPAPSVQQQDDE